MYMAAKLMAFPTIGVMLIHKFSRGASQAFTVDIEVAQEAMASLSMCAAQEHSKPFLQHHSSTTLEMFGQMQCPFYVGSKSANATVLPRVSGNPQDVLERHQIINHDEVNIIKILQPDRLTVVTHPAFEFPILVKTASSASDKPSLHREAEIYKLLQDTGTTPQFLGYVTKAGQVTGIIIEYIEEDREKGLDGCLSTLRQLHKRGIAHGDAHDGNCLIRKDGSAVLIDFELSLETWSLGEFERDLDIMSRCIDQAAGGDA